MPVEPASNPVPINPASVLPDPGAVAPEAGGADRQWISININDVSVDIHARRDRPVVLTMGDGTHLAARGSGGPHPGQGVLAPVPAFSGAGQAAEPPRAPGDGGREPSPPRAQRRRESVVEPVRTAADYVSRRPGHGLLPPVSAFTGAGRAAEPPRPAGNGGRESSPPRAQRRDEPRREQNRPQPNGGREPSSANREGHFAPVKSTAPRAPASGQANARRSSARPGGQPPARSPRASAPQAVPPAAPAAQAAPVELPRQPEPPASPGFWHKWGGVVGNVCRVVAIATIIGVGISSGGWAALPLGLWLGAEWLWSYARNRRERQQEALRMMRQESAAQNRPDANRDVAPPQRPARPNPVAAAAPRPRPEAGGAHDRREVPPQAPQPPRPRPTSQSRPPAHNSATAAAAPARTGRAAAGPSAVDPGVRRMAQHFQLHVNRQNAETALNDWRQGADERARLLLQQNIRSGERVLDLRHLNLAALPVQALRYFVWLNAIKLSPRLLRRATGSGQAGAAHGERARLDEASVQASLARWRQSNPRLGAVDERFFLDAFRNELDTLDLRGRDLPSLPDVVMDFPKLRTLVVSREFMARHQRLRGG